MAKQIFLTAVVLAAVGVSVWAVLNAPEAPKLEPKPDEAQPTDTAKPAAQEAVTKLQSRLDAIDTQMQSVNERLESLTSEPEAPGPYIAPARVNGQDLADLNGVRLWRFEYSMPPREYVCRVWSETLSRESDGQMVLVNESPFLESTVGVFSAGAIVIKPPTKSDPRLLLRIGETILVRADQFEPMGVPSLSTVASLAERRALTFGENEDIDLITYTHRTPTLRPDGTVESEGQPDVIVKVRIRFQVHNPATAG